MLTHPAYEHDEIGARKMEQEQARMGLDQPLVQYVDSAYIWASKLVEAQAQGRELIGPALPGPQKDGRFTAAQFQINVEERHAVCPAGKVNTQCSRLVEASTGKISYRFEFSTQCHDCALHAQCLGKGQRHRSLVVGEHHTALQARRQEQQTPAFKQRMKHRNAIEGTQSELVRAHGLRHARYRGLAKVALQNYFIAAACNAKRWIRREAWNFRQTAALISESTTAAADAN
jgi:transposase